MMKVLNRKLFNVAGNQSIQPKGKSFTASFLACGLLAVAGCSQTPTYSDQDKGSQKTKQTASSGYRGKRRAAAMDDDDPYFSMDPEPAIQQANETKDSSVNGKADAADIAPLSTQLPSTAPTSNDQSNNQTGTQTLKTRSFVLPGQPIDTSAKKGRDLANSQPDVADRKVAPKQKDIEMPLSVSAAGNRQMPVEKSKGTVTQRTELVKNGSADEGVVDQPSLNKETASVDKSKGDLSQGNVSAEVQAAQSGEPSLKPVTMVENKKKEKNEVVQPTATMTTAEGSSAVNATKPVAEGRAQSMTKAGDKAALSSLEQLPMTIDGHWTLALHTKSGVKPVCALTQSVRSMSDGQGGTPLELILMRDQIRIATKSNIDITYPDDGLKIDGDPVVALDKVENESTAVIETDVAQIIQRLRTARRLDVFLGFWPTWPVTETHRQALKVDQFVKAEAMLAKCETLL